MFKAERLRRTPAMVVHICQIMLEKPRREQERKKRDKTRGRGQKTRNNQDEKETFLFCLVSNGITIHVVNKK